MREYKKKKIMWIWSQCLFHLLTPLWIAGCELHCHRSESAGKDTYLRGESSGGQFSSIQISFKFCILLHSIHSCQSQSTSSFTSILFILCKRIFLGLGQASVLFQTPNVAAQSRSSLYAFLKAHFSGPPTFDHISGLLNFVFFTLLDSQLYAQQRRKCKEILQMISGGGEEGGNNFISAL